VTRAKWRVVPIFRALSKRCPLLAGQYSVVGRSWRPPADIDGLCVVLTLDGLKRAFVALLKRGEKKSDKHDPVGR